MFMIRNWKKVTGLLHVGARVEIAIVDELSSGVDGMIKFFWRDCPALKVGTVNSFFKEKKLLKTWISAKLIMTALFNIEPSTPNNLSS